MPSATEIVAALGLTEQLMAITHECDFPIGIEQKPHITASRINHESMTSREIDEHVRSQLDGHNTIYDLDEKLLGKISPDVILTQELCDVCAVNYEIVKKSAKVYAADAKIVSLEPTTISEILENIETVAEICGVPEKGREVVERLNSRMTSLRSSTAKIESKPDVFMLEWLDPPFAPGHWVPEQVELAGGNCLLGRAGERSVTLSFEQVIETDPDLICLIPCGFTISDIEKHLKTTSFPSALKEVKAIRNNEVYALDATSYFSRPGPRVVEGAEILAAVIHPEMHEKPLTSQAVQVDVSKLVFKESKSA